MGSSKTVAEEPASTGLRRAPRQHRSSVRLEEILAAAAELSDEIGYDDITTGLIATRANVAIGTVYRFFDDKPAVYRALSVRHFEIYLEKLQRALDGAQGESWRQLIEATIDCYVSMRKDVPGFRGFGDAIDLHLLDEAKDNDSVLADQLIAISTERFGVPPTAELQLAVLVAVTAADSLLALAFRRDPDGDAAVIAEAKAVVRLYLAPHFEPPQFQSRDR